MAVGTCLLDLLGCGHVTGVEGERLSPDGRGRAALVRYEPRPLGRERMRFEVSLPRHRHVVSPADVPPYVDYSLEARLCFVAVAWSPDSRYAGAYARTRRGETSGSRWTRTRARRWEPS